MISMVLTSIVVGIILCSITLHALVFVGLRSRIVGPGVATLAAVIVSIGCFVLGILV